VEQTMTYIRNPQLNIRKVGYSSLLLALLLLTAVSLLFSASDNKFKVGTIGATAWGTNTQVGQSFNMSVVVREFSNEADRAILVEAFQKAQNQGLVNALTKMRTVGRISMDGTLDYDLSYIRLIPTPTGRKIRFVTNRKIRFGEAYYDTKSIAYNLTAGEIEINDVHKDKSSGILFPEAQLVINQEGQIEFELHQNPWKLVNIMDWDKVGAPIE
jgi:hypothetical protein